MHSLFYEQCQRGDPICSELHLNLNPQGTHGNTPRETQRKTFSYTVL